MQRLDFHIDYVTRRCIFVECPNNKFALVFISTQETWSITDYTMELHRPGWSSFPFPLQSLHRTKTGVEHVCVTAQDAIIVVDQMIVFFLGVCTI